MTAAANGALRVTVVGCSGSVPGPDSPGSCYLVQADGADRTWSLVMDLGGGALGPLQRYIDPLDLDAVLLSHLHPDHCLDLTGLYVLHRHRPARGPADDRRRMPVFAPEGADQRLARAYGVAAAESVDGVFDFGVLADRVRFQVGPLQVTAVAVNHPVPTFGFRIETGHAVLAYTGDTDDCAALDELMTGADLVLADSAFVEGRDTQPDVHLSGRRAGRAATRAGGVGTLVLTHLPPWNDPDVCRAEAQQTWSRGLRVATQGAHYQIGH